MRYLDVVDYLDAGDDALCVLFANGSEAVPAVLNARHAAYAREHAEAHVRAGLDGPQVCTLDCRG